jgi:hypothetical protein
MVQTYKSGLRSQLDNALIDFGQNENMTRFVSFFASPLRTTALEWIENFISANGRDQSLIQLLYSRMRTDGCHLSLLELQSVLALFICLKQLFHCDQIYLLLLCSSVEQSKLIDVLLYTRLEYDVGRRFDPDSKIFGSINAIQNSRYKSLFAVKLNEYRQRQPSSPPLDRDDLYKITLMLQNASNGAEQLEKIGLDEWISIARKQKWSEIGYLLQQYGSIGYYLALLDNNGFSQEVGKMRDLFEQATLVPEKLIALYTQWIISRESDANIFDELRKLFRRANEYASDKYDESTMITRRHELVTNEIGKI